MGMCLVPWFQYTIFGTADAKGEEEPVLTTDYRDGRRSFLETMRIYRIGYYLENPRNFLVF